MSPRAACRLEQLGFTDVYDFVDGKSYWIGSGLPTEGTRADQPRAGTAADPSVPTCRPDDTVAGAKNALAATGWDQCIVLADDRIVVGRLRTRELEADARQRVENVMETGPSTIRPDTPLADILRRMTDRNLASVVVTKPTGELIGVLRRMSPE